jgi:hypothetical protein
MVNYKNRSCIAKKSKSNPDAYTKEELIDIRNEYINDTFEFGQNVEEISLIDEQLKYLNKNIKTFEDALMCHETKIFEKRTSMGDLGELCLN